MFSYVIIADSWMWHTELFYLKGILDVISVSMFGALESAMEWNDSYWWHKTFCLVLLNLWCKGISSSFGVREVFFCLIWQLTCITVVQMENKIICNAFLHYKGNLIYLKIQLYITICFSCSWNIVYNINHMLF